MRRPPLRRDRAAVADVPHRLLLSVALMAMAAAVLLPALEAYQLSELEGRVEVGTAQLASAARAVAAHPGSSRTVALDLSGSWSARLDRMTVGAALGSSPAEMAIITWRLSGKGEGRAAVTSSGAPVPLCGPDGDALELAEGRALLVLEARRAPAGLPVDGYVEVRLA